MAPFQFLAPKLNTSLSELPLPGAKIDREVKIHGYAGGGGNCPSGAARLARHAESILKASEQGIYVSCFCRKPEVLLKVF